jgi:plastocyanin
MTRTLAVIAAATIAAAGSTALPAAGATKSIKLLDNRFSPRTATVKRGTTVKFVWAGKNPHNVFVVKGPVRFNSSTKTKGSYVKKLTKKGSYALVCTIHSGMTLTLKVR